jgi:large subunit ribosomal protein L29
MATKTLEEFRKMAPDLLKEREGELRTELFKLRTGNSTEKVKNTSQFKRIKKDVARIQTILREQELKTSKPKAKA